MPAAIALCLLLATAVAAQSRQRKNSQPRPETASPAQTSRTDAAAPLPDLEITANVSVRELKFEQVGNAKVEFTGKPTRDTVSNADIQNLPRPVEPGVTYHNVGVRLVIRSAFADLDRIVSEILGESSPPAEQVEKKPDAEQPPQNLSPKVTPRKPGRKP